MKIKAKTKKLITSVLTVLLVAAAIFLIQKYVLPRFESGDAISTVAVQTNDETKAQTPHETKAEPKTEAITEAKTEAQTEPPIKENGVYTTKEDVALYIHTYGKLPSNFIKKAEAEALGWPGGELEKYAPGKCIGGDYFSNREGLLPKANGRKYTECDIDTLGAKSRGAKRIVFSNDGLIFYTEDHYESFTQLY